MTKEEFVWFMRAVGALLVVALITLTVTVSVHQYYMTYYTECQ